MKITDHNKTVNKLIKLSPDNRHRFIRQHNSFKLSKSALINRYITDYVALHALPFLVDPKDWVIALGGKPEWINLWQTMGVNDTFVIAHLRNITTQHCLTVTIKKIGKHLYQNQMSYTHDISLDEAEKTILPMDETDIYGAPLQFEWRDEVFVFHDIRQRQHYLPQYPDISAQTHLSHFEDFTERCHSTLALYRRQPEAEIWPLWRGLITAESVYALSEYEIKG